MGLRGGPGGGPGGGLTAAAALIRLPAASSSSGENTSMSSKGVQRGSCCGEEGEGSRVTAGVGAGTI